MTFELSSPQVVSEDFQEGVVILNLDSGQYFDVGERSVPLLKALVAGHCIDGIKSGVEEIEDGAGSQVDEFLSKMVGYELLRKAEAKNMDFSVAQSQEIIDAGKSFVLDCYDDLAELIAADPVHDVDSETGRILR